MATKRKANQLGVYTDDKAGISVPLMLDRATCEFYAEVFDQTLRHKTMGGLQSLVAKTIRDSVTLDWKPIITIERYEPFAAETEDFVGFKIERSYIAQDLSKNWLEVEWDWFDREDIISRLSVAHRFASSKFEMYRHGVGFRNTDKVFHVDYSDAAWTALETIIVNIRALRARLDELMQTREGVAQLESFAGKMLPAETV